MILDKHGNIVVGTQDNVLLDQPTMQARQETIKITQEESEEITQNVKEKSQQFSPENLPTLEVYLNDNEINQQILDQKMPS